MLPNNSKNKPLNFGGITDNKIIELKHLSF